MGSTRLTSRRRQDQSFKWARIAIAILATIGVIDTGSITIHRWGWLGSLSCPGGAEGCDKVLNSAWGTIFQGDGFSIPLSLLGCIGYLTVLLLAILPLLPGLSENKADLSRRTWWGLFATSCGMAIFSLILIGLMVIKIKAFCFFCVVSAIISILLLILTIIGGGWEEPGELIFRGILLSLGVLLGGLIWTSSVDPATTEIVLTDKGVPPAVKTISNQYQIDLAQHLTKKGIVMYSAYWCPHCHDQKDLFGKQAVNKLIVIECAPEGKDSQSSLCESKGITAFPSWEVDGKIESGVKSIEELTDISGFKKIR